MAINREFRIIWTDFEPSPFKLRAHFSFFYFRLCPSTGPRVERNNSRRYPLFFPPNISSSVWVKNVFQQFVKKNPIQPLQTSYRPKYASYRNLDHTLNFRTLFLNRIRLASRDSNPPPRMTSQSRHVKIPTSLNFNLP